MANQQVGNGLGVAACSVGNGSTNRSNVNGGTGNPDAAYTDSDGANIAALRTRLDAIDSTTYTAAYMDKMTLNDMLYAVRLNDSPTTIK